MSIMIGKYYFDGPYSSLNKLKNNAGLYCVHCKEDQQQILDIGEAAMIKDRIKTHERMKCWLRHSQELGISVSVYYTKHWNQSSRMKAVQNLRQKYSPPCSKKSDSKIYFLNDND